MQNFNLDSILMKFSDEKGNSTWTIREAVEGVQIFGGIGSGKTSGSGKMIAMKYLESGFGGLVLTAKPDEKDLWINYCKKAGRLKDLVVIEPGGKIFFNFIEYEASATGGQKFTENIVQVLKTVIRASDEKDGGNGDDKFWETALDMLIYNVIDLSRLAYNTVSVNLMYELTQTAPKKGQQPRTADERAKSEPNAFQAAYEAARGRITAEIDEYELKYPNNSRTPQEQAQYEKTMYDAVPNLNLLKLLHEFFYDQYGQINEKTRSIIEFTFSGFLFKLLKDPIHSIFCKHPSNILPEHCSDGKIILLNFPVKEYHKVGRDIQIMFKYIWQRAMEKRKVGEGERPVFLWADEAQNFLHEHDAEYQATARSSKIATVYISQNLPNYMANMGGNKFLYKVKSFLGTLGTKIFHANADIDTNQYASELIGRDYAVKKTKTMSVAETASISVATTTELVNLVRPEEFVGMMTGGKKNNNLVEGYMHRQGSKFHDRRNHRRIVFNQL